MQVHGCSLRPPGGKRKAPCGDTQEAIVTAARTATAAYAILIPKGIYSNSYSKLQLAVGPVCYVETGTARCCYVEL